MHFDNAAKNVPDFNSWRHRSSNVQTLSTVYNHLFFFCDSGLILEVNEPFPFLPECIYELYALRPMLEHAFLTAKFRPLTRISLFKNIYFISNISLTTARKLSLISLGQTRLQLDPNPWMMNLVSRLVLKWDSITLRNKEKKKSKKFNRDFYALFTDHWSLQIELPRNSIAFSKGLLN